jgi:hypothetical protein
LVHEGGFGVKGRLLFYDPWGRALPDAPELKAASASATARQQQRGLAINDQTRRPDRDGGALDGYALDVIIGATRARGRGGGRD